MDVGARIKELRKAKGLSTKELAEATKISQPVISRLETNTRSADVAYLEIICEVLGITLADFFAADHKELTPELQQLLEAAKKLSPEQRAIIQQLLESMHK